MQNRKIAPWARVRYQRGDGYNYQFVDKFRLQNYCLTYVLAVLLHQSIFKKLSAHEDAASIMYLLQTYVDLARLCERTSQVQSKNEPNS